MRKEFAMWRKPDEPKVSASVPGPTQFESSAPRAEVATPSTATSATNSASRAIAAPPASGAVLSTSLNIKGEISGHEDLYVDAEVHGKIEILDAKVTVGPHGRVFADIDAHEIVVRGKVQGSLRGRERVEIAATGDVHGDVSARRLVIDEGAAVRGSIEVERPAEVAQPRVARVMETEPARPAVLETAEP
jgi:cytoskeletal protein CcmA (bactofilin family)